MYQVHHFFCSGYLPTVQSPRIEIKTNIFLMQYQVSIQTAEYLSICSYRLDKIN